MITDSKTRFTSRVADYVEGRPTYPAALIEWLQAKIGFAADWSVVDIGAGTGISTDLFLSAGNHVTAVEPNDAMRAAAGARFAGDGNYQSVAAPAEAITLPDGSADLIVAAQAFHWFDHAAFARECRRLLTPRGRVLLIWNTATPDASLAALAYQTVLKRHAIDLARVEGKWRDGENVAIAWFEADTFLRDALPNSQTFDADRLFKRLASSSYMPQRDHPRFESMRDDVNAAFVDHATDGVYTLPYQCDVFLGVPRA